MSFKQSLPELTCTRVTGAGALVKMRILSRVGPGMAGDVCRPHFWCVTLEVTAVSRGRWAHRHPIGPFPTWTLSRWIHGSDGEPSWCSARGGRWPPWTGQEVELCTGQRVPGARGAARRLPSAWPQAVTQPWEPNRPQCTEPPAELTGSVPAGGRGLWWL